MYFLLLYYTLLLFYYFIAYSAHMNLLYLNKKFLFTMFSSDFVWWLEERVSWLNSVTRCKMETSLFIKLF